MSEMGEDFAAWREVKREKKASNLEASTQMLHEAGVDFTSHNSGVHLKIYHNEAPIIDFWPSTGMWMIAATKQKNRGVRNLLNYIKGLK